MSIYQHFRPEEKEFIDQVINWRDFVTDNYAPKLTDFLDPREQFIVRSMIGTETSCKVDFFGGHAFVERKRALIYPEYIQPDNEDYELVLFEIDYPEKFVNLEHPKVLGSLMGLGLRRGKFGDILVTDKRVQFFTAKEIADYIQLNFHQVGKTTVTLSEKPLDAVISVEESMDEVQVTVSSLRLDAVLSALSKLSREKASNLIKQGLVKVNWKTVEQPSFDLQTNDLISARGLGRMKIIQIGEKTKKDKWRLTAGKIK